MKGGLISSLNRSVQNQDRPFIIFNCFIHGTLETCALPEKFLLFQSLKETFLTPLLLPRVVQLPGEGEARGRRPWMCISLSSFLPHCCLSSRAGWRCVSTVHSPGSYRKSLIWRRLVLIGWYQFSRVLSSLGWALQLPQGFYLRENHPCQQGQC